MKVLKIDIELSGNFSKKKITHLRIFQHINAQSIIGPEGANDSMAHLYTEEYK